MNEINNNKNKIIIPMPFRHVSTMYLFFSEEQIKIVVAGAIASIGLLGLFSSLQLPFNIIPLLFILSIWIAFFKYARTPELLMRSTALFKYHIRRIRGYTTVEKYNKMHNNKVVIYPNITVKQAGLIDFSNGKYGYIISCTPKKTEDEESVLQVENIRKFFNGFNQNLLIKISARNQNENLNAVQEMTAKKITNSKTIQEKNILYSIYNMSAEAPKPGHWYFNIFIGLNSTDKEIKAYSNALMPGIIKVLENARIPCRVLTDEKSILNVYANDFTAGHFSKHARKAAIFSDSSLWKNVSNMLLPARLEEKTDHVIIDKSEYVSCVLVGIPKGGISGYPSDLSPGLLSQLFAISASDNLIRLDLAVLPIEGAQAVSNIKRVMDKIDSNKETAKGRTVVQQDLNLDRQDYEVLLGKLKNGEDKLYHVSFLISVYSANYEALIAGISQVKAILSANNVLGEIPYGRVLDSLKASQLLPNMDLQTSVELPTTALSRIAPIVSNSNSMTSKDGTYFGNDEDEEIIINQDDLAAGHMLAIGATGSGKTTGLLTMMIRDVVYLNRKVIYISIKEDIGTNYRACAEYFGKDAQIIDLGTKGTGEAKYNINPLEILVDESTVFNSESVFYRHISILKQFFTVLCKLDSVNQTAYLELSLMELYDNFGMSPYKPATWKPARPPTLKDLHEIWKRDKEFNVTAEALYNKTTSINYAWKFLSSPTNVNLSKKFIIMDLSGIPADLSEAMNYLLTAVLSLRFNISAKQKTSIYIDEGRVFLKNPILADDIVKYLTQARSYGIRLILATQQLSDLRHVSEEFKTNTFLNLIFGNNSGPSMDILAKYFQLSESDQQYLRNCNRQGQALLLVGPPYSQSYHIFMKLSQLEEQIILGKNSTPALVSQVSFSHPDLAILAEEQGVIFSDWVEGDTSNLRASRTAIFQQRAVGNGKHNAYLKPELIQADGHILNQTPDHYLTAVSLCGHLISKGIPAKINHYEDADVIAHFPGKTVAFEYQTLSGHSGNNDPDRLIMKRQKAENQYGYVFFIGNSESVPEIKRALQNDEIVISRGKELEKLIDSLIEAKSEVTISNSADYLPIRLESEA
jgi:hypothetical protein